MAKRWSEVLGNPEFQALPDNEKAMAQEEYFATVVAPNVSRAEQSRAKYEFLKEFPPPVPMDVAFRGPEPESSYMDTLKAMPGLAMAGAGQFIGGTERMAGNSTLGDIERAIDPLAGARQQIRKAILGEPTVMETPISPAMAQAGKDLQQGANIQAQEITPKNQNIIQDAMTSLAQSAPAFAGSIAAGAVTKSPATALALMGIGTGGQSYGEALDAGKGHEEALRYGKIQGFLEAGGEILPVKAIMKAGTPLFRRIMNAMVAEGVSEGATEAAQDLHSYIAGMDDSATFGEFLRKLPRNVTVAALAGAGMGAGGAAAAHPFVKGDQNTELPAPQDQTKLEGQDVVSEDWAKGPGSLAKELATDENIAKKEEALGKLVTQSKEREGTQPATPPVAQPAPAVERRHDPIRTKRIGEMSLEEARHALRTDDMTGLLSKRAYLEDTGMPDLEEQSAKIEPGGVVTAIDADSLKYLNDNLGQPFGDTYLRMVGSVVRSSVGKGMAYHISGDEFTMTFKDNAEADAALEALQNDIKGRIINMTLADGTSVRLSGVTITAAKGKSHGEAFKRLKSLKEQRQSAGLRAPRGERPAWADIRRPEGWVDPRRAETTGGADKAGKIGKQDRENLLRVDSPATASPIPSHPGSQTQAEVLAQRQARAAIKRDDSPATMIRKLGGIRPDSPMAEELLHALGIDPKNRKAAGTILRNDGMTVAQMMERVSQELPEDTPGFQDGGFVFESDFLDWAANPQDQGGTEAEFEKRMAEGQRREYERWINTSHGLARSRGKGLHEFTEKDIKTAVKEGADEEFARAEVEAAKKEWEDERAAMREEDTAENTPVEVAPGVMFSLKKPLRDTEVPTPDNTFERLGIPKGKVFADYEALYQKHPDNFESAEDVKSHVEYVLENPSVILPGNMPDHRMIVRQNGADKAVVLEVELKGGKYRVRSAYTLLKGQLETKMEKASQGGGRISTGPARNRSESEIASPGSTVPSDTDSLESHSPEPNISPSGEKGKADAQAVLDRYVPGETRIVEPATPEEKAADQFARGLGLEPVFFEGDPNRQGFVPTGETRRIFINTKAASDPMMYVAGHETLHSLRNNHPDLYAKLADFVKGEISQDDIEAHRLHLEELQRQAGINGEVSADVALEELVADLAGRRVMEPEFLNRLKEHDKGLFEKIIEAIEKILARVKEMIGKEGESNPAMEKFRDRLDALLADTLVEFANRKPTTKEYFESKAEVKKALSGKAKATGGDGWAPGLWEKPPVKVTEVKEPGLSGAGEAFEFLRGYQKSGKPLAVNRDTGWAIGITRAGVAKTGNYYARHSGDQAKSVGAIPALLERAVYAFKEGNRNSKTAREIPFYHHFFAPVKIEGKLYTARLVVEEHSDGKKFYLPELYEKEKIDSDPARTPNPRSGQARTGSTSNINVRDLLANVKSKWSPPRYSLASAKPTSQLDRVILRHAGRLGFYHIER